MTTDDHHNPPIWTQPPPDRRGGFTFVTLKLADGEPDITVTLNLESLANALGPALDDTALADLADLLELPPPLPSRERLNAMTDEDLASLSGTLDTLADDLELTRIALTAVRVQRQRLAAAQAGSPAVQDGPYAYLNRDQNLGES